MRWFLRPAFGTGLLLALVSALASFEYFRPDPGQTDQSPGNVLAVQAVAAREMGQTQRARSAAFYNAITERPLFAPTRRPVVAESGPELAEQAPEAEEIVEIEATEFSLMGSMQSETGAVALISVDDGEAVWVALGDVVSGWELSEVTAVSVSLSRANQTLELDLYPR